MGEELVPGGGDQLVPAEDGEGLGLSTVDLIAATLRADAEDLSTYARVLTSSIASILPEGMVEIDRDRSMSDRVAGRPGAVRAIRARFGEFLLELSEHKGVASGAVVREVRGVVISRREVALEEWTRLFAENLERFAAEHAAAREALSRLLGAP